MQNNNPLDSNSVHFKIEFESIEEKTKYVCYSAINCEEGVRLDKALASVDLISTRSRAENLIEAGSVRLFDSLSERNAAEIFDELKSLKSSFKPKVGDLIIVRFISERSSSDLKPTNIPLAIVFEDQDFIIINKPAGLVVHPAVGHYDDTLVNALLYHQKDLSMKFNENRPGIVHRLDKETSGLIVVAKNDFAHEHLSNQFKARKVHRVYFAAVFGSPKNTKDRLQSRLIRHPENRKKYCSIKGQNKNAVEISSQQGPFQHNEQEELPGKIAITNYEVLKSQGGLSYLKLKLETGRTHQIRVHLSEMGHPIIKDELYGASKKESKLPAGKVKEIVREFSRFALHAAELGVYHPRTEEFLNWKVAWPDDLGMGLKVLGFADCPGVKAYEDETK